MTYRKGDYVVGRIPHFNHCFIYLENGIENRRMVAHFPCTECLTEKVAEKMIDRYLRLVQELKVQRAFSLVKMQSLYLERNRYEFERV